MAAIRNSGDAMAMAAEAKLTAEEAMALAKSTHEMVRDLHRALIEPQAGHEAGLLHRMATATIAWEQGGATGNALIKAAKMIGAVGAISAAIAGGIHYFQGLPK